MISIVCVYNNEKTLSNYLLKGLKNQTLNHELILLDNTKKTFKSAAEALNIGGKKANGDYIIFIHQDIFLGFNSCLEVFERTIKKLRNLGIAGIAGTVEKKNNKEEFIFANMTHGIPPTHISKFKLKNPIEAQTLDECLIIIPRRIFNKIQFDEKICDHWHFYAVDYCLSIKRYGFDSYILPIDSIHHKSAPGYSEEFYLTLERVLKKHKKHSKRIYATMGKFSTSFFLKVLKIRRLLKKSRLFFFKKIVFLLLFYYNKIWHYSKKIKNFLLRFFYDFESFNNLITFERSKLLINFDLYEEKTNLLQ